MRRDSPEYDPELETIDHFLEQLGSEPSRADSYRVAGFAAAAASYRDEGYPFGKTCADMSRWQLIRWVEDSCLKGETLNEARALFLQENIAQPAADPAKQAQQIIRLLDRFANLIDLYRKDGSPDGEAAAGLVLWANRKYRNRPTTDALD